MTENRQIRKVTFAQAELDQEYVDCEFIQCTFTEILFGKVNFENCVFNQCNLSLCKSNATSWYNVQFIDCKMTGMEFSNCNNYTLSAKFVRCNLRYALFVGNKLSGTTFDECNLQDVDFSEANLKDADFGKCDLAHAVFVRTNLENADFSTSFNFEISPVNNKLHKAKFTHLGLEGLVTYFGVEIVD